MIGAEEALRIGLINAVHKFEDLEKSTISFAKKIAKQSPHAIKVAKRTIRASLDLPFSEGILTERSEFVALFDTEDKEIGVKAFLQRKDALWLGK
jgi:enoyl-CoA hydratase/carnithine racemase